MVALVTQMQGQNSVSCNYNKVFYDDGYIIDGQSYTLTFDEKPQVSMYIVFFSGYDYRIYFCSKSIKKYRIYLYDIERKLLISEFCEQYQQSLDMRFDSNLAAIVEVHKVVENEQQLTHGDIKLTVGFKDNKQVEFK
jgi:hypothetical protein